ncbi:hypothetical protein [Parasitella parasitica]|uniref:Uncharacterized protein n=1 Tax=Parasitella parasitica TaxID=35722 RepID=A0A0B7MNK1_9FUNG|nr:hypothetical protein [Parasitella parasitica]
MDGYFQSTLAANTLQQNISRNNANNATAQATRVVPYFPPTNKDFSCTELHTPDGIYPLLHETFYETIAPQFTTGTRVSIVSAKDENFHLANNESSEDEGLIIGGPSFSMTPAKSAALPIPNATSSKMSLRNTLTTSSSTSSMHANNGNGLQVLPSLQKINTSVGNSNNTNPYSSYSTSFSTTLSSQLPSSSQSPAGQHPQQQQQHQFASGSYMMSSSQDLGMPNLSISNTNDYSLPSSFNNSSNPNNTGSVGSLSSLFGKSINPTGARSTPQSSSSMVRSMSTSFNILFGLIQTEPLSRIVFSKSYPICHDINETTRSDDHLDIIIGFSTGDIIWYDPLSCKYVRLNKGGAMVNAAVSMIKWIPGSEELFVAIFKNGTVLIMDKERDDQIFNIPDATSWMESQPHRSNKYNPVSVWKIGDKGLTDFVFAPDGIHLAITSMDGQLLIIDYRSEKLTDAFSSYYGKLTCVDWSPDGHYILTGGEDDLVTLWSFSEKRIIARCPGHKSWVTGVAFDRWRCEDKAYRFGSVGEDCNLILWDFSFSALQKPKHVSNTHTKSSFNDIAQILCQPRTIGSSPPSMLPKMWVSSVSTASSSSAAATSLQPNNNQTALPINIERKKSLKSHRLFRGFSSPDTTSLISTSTGTSSTTGSFGRFRKRSFRSNNIFAPSNDFGDDVIVEDQLKQHIPVLHPPVKKNQAAILQPTTIKAIHADPCLSLIFREHTFVTTDRRGRIRTWGRPRV